MCYYCSTNQNNIKLLEVTNWSKEDSLVLQRSYYEADHYSFCTKLSFHINFPVNNISNICLYGINYVFLQSNICRNLRINNQWWLWLTDFYSLISFYTDFMFGRNLLIEFLNSAIGMSLLNWCC